jgi:hypothetical protein
MIPLEKLYIPGSNYLLSLKIFLRDCPVVGASGQKVSAGESPRESTSKSRERDERVERTYTRGNERKM